MAPENGEAPADGPPASIHPAYTYAFRRLGFLLTETNAHLFDDDDVRRWNEAVADGERIYGPIDPE